MSEEKHLPCQICGAVRVLIDGINCNTCYEMLEYMRNYYQVINDRFNKTTKGN